MKNMGTVLKNQKIRRAYFIFALVTLLTACGDDRGGVIVDSSGEQGGGTQPGGGGFAFVILFLVVTVSVIGMFTMDRVKKNKQRQDSDDQ